MLLEQYEKIREFEQRSSANAIVGSDLSNQEDRTLLYGYTVERETVHVYLYGGEIFCVTYFYKEEPKLKQITTNRDYLPNKRAYPEQCDYEFCHLLLKHDQQISFTTFNEETAKKKTGKYMGEVLPEHI
ncbi:hypothetical protein [Aeromonas veronii]|uniref:Uncharacterized protein n=1 Tax=Aeromonas veronii TaxID=654 RepID=A0A2T4MUI1_AERVE|nr:hypothetical protein [Aeromonas veronii]PTH78213.1 hypothetical protein DAA48_25765 [Aeromonas veronii]